jgi:hypothetical protein
LAPAGWSVHVPGQLTPQLSASISPDGRRLAFVSTDAAGRSMLWLRALDAQDAQVVAGTENAAHPVRSPDGRSIAFLAEGKLKTIDSGGGAVHTLADAAIRLAPSWSRDGIILFKPSLSGLGTVPATGGAVTPVSFKDPAIHASATWPYFLPDGRHFLFSAPMPQVVEVSTSGRSTHPTRRCSSPPTSGARTRRRDFCSSSAAKRCLRSRSMRRGER